MSRLMSEAEIIFWDVVLPINKKSKAAKVEFTEKIDPKKDYIEINNKDLPKNRKEIKKDFEIQRQPKNIKPDRASKKLLSNEFKTGNSQIFMVFCSSLMGLIIGFMVSIIL